MQTFYVTEKKSKHALTASKSKQPYLEKEVKGYPFLKLISNNSVFDKINLWEHLFYIFGTKNKIKIINVNLFENAVLVIYKKLGLKIVFLDCEIVDTEKTDYKSMLRLFFILLTMIEDCNYDFAYLKQNVFAYLMKEAEVGYEDLIDLTQNFRCQTSFERNSHSFVALTNPYHYFYLLLNFYLFFY
ncbi:hypothetical protein MHBO_002477 [Bonamia ostreae]|uniref:Uncharacterized protein n=1 Tax=Bonamia ostreae TaxID=126728 RepID=A0ABV2AMI2_9EUKA